MKWGEALRALHKAFWFALRPLVRLFAKIKFGYTCKIVKKLPKQYIVLANHATDYDPLFVGAAFRRQMYFVASEHIGRWGFASALIKTFLAPILRSKGSIASSTVKSILKAVKNGDRVALFAEGTRTWDGRTDKILPSTGKLIKKSGVALVTYKLKGGYFVSPRWSDNLRKGKISGELVQLYSAEQLAAMSADEINEIINRDLYEDAYARMAESPTPYKGKNLAKSMENLLFLCPFCEAENSLSSSGNRVSCDSCGSFFTVDEYGTLEHAPAKTVAELADAQRARLTLEKALSTPYGRLCTVHEGQERAVDEGEIVMTRTALCCGGTQIAVADIAELDIHGKFGVVFTANGKYFELTPQGNAVKYFYFYNFIKAKEADL